MITFLLIFTTYIVVRIAFKIAQQYRCPDQEVLSDYFTGRLKKQRSLYDQTIAHLGVCESCREKLAAMAAGDEPLEDHLINRKEME